MKEEKNGPPKTREMEGPLKLYGSHQMTEDAILHNQPITAIWAQIVSCILHNVPLVMLVILLIYCEPIDK